MPFVCNSNTMNRQITCKMLLMKNVQNGCEQPRGCEERWDLDPGFDAEIWECFGQAQMDLIYP